MPGAIRGENGATPPRNTVGCQRNWTKLGRRHHCAVGFTENLGLFEVPKTEVIHRRAPWKTKAAVELATLEWVSWFNHQRLLESIGDIPPAEAEARYYRQLAAQTVEPV